MTAVLGAGSYWSSVGGPADEFAADVAASGDLELGEPERADLRSRLAALLLIPGVTASAKALDLLSEHERLFLTARILTDLRPVFGEGEVATPTAALITHTLKIEYHDASGRDALYMALDDGDLEKFIEVLTRAQKKSSSLRSLVATTGMTLLSPTPET
jgi:hypothetical protein